MWDKPAGLSDADILQLKGAEYFTQPPTPPGKVRASHLLIKHKDSRRPSSWKTPTISRTIEEATATLRGHQAALLAAPDLQKAFAELASTESDCSSARDGGDLGERSGGLGPGGDSPAKRRKLTHTHAIRMVRTQADAEAV